MDYNLVGESIKFMILGMLVVYVFLYILVLVMKLQAKLIAKYLPEKEIVATPAESRSKTTVAEAPSEDNSAVAAVIIAAIAEYNKNKS